MSAAAESIDIIKDITETWRPHVATATKVRVQYEFLVDSNLQYYIVEIGKDSARFSAGQLSDSDSDIIIRTRPEAMVSVLRGEIGAREAMMSGVLDIRKVSSMPQLLVLRGLFSQYKKDAQKLDQV